MKKVLILAYDFPPYVSVGGLRPYAWHKYFKEFDLYPIVVTRQWSNKHKNHLDYIDSGKSSNTIIEETEYGKIIRTPYKPNFSNRIILKYGDKKYRIVRKIISAWFEFIQYIFFVGPKSKVYKGANEYLKANKVDIIIATGDPFILFKYASKLSKKYKIPWIADYRDPWIQDKIQSKSQIRILWEKYNEKRFVKSANGITTVSKLLLNFIQENIKVNIPSEIVFNGYDNNHIIDTSCVTSKSKLVIAYAGSLYDWHPVESVINVFNKLIKNDIKIELNFYGCNNPDRVSLALKENEQMQKTTKLFPKIPNNQLMKELSKSHLLLLFNDYSISGTKIYDYLAVKRNIVLCYSNDKDAFKLKEKHFHFPKMNGQSEQLQSEIINKTNGGIIATDQKNLTKIITDFWNEYLNTGELICNSKNTEKYTRKNSTKRMASFINKVLHE